MAVFQGGTGSDSLAGSNSPDNMDGLGGNDTLSGLGGNDKLVGGTGADRLLGGSGDDLLIGLTGADWLDGGSGVDWVSYEASPVAVLVSLLGAGQTRYGHADGDSLLNIENIRGSGYHDHLIGNAGANFLDSSKGADHVEGEGGNDTLAGGDGADILQGGEGDDDVSGGKDDDVLDGGAGGDFLKGGPGNDSYRVDNAADRVQEFDGEGVDTVRTGLADYTLSAHVENLTLTGAAHGRGGGNALNNSIYGNGGNNLLLGGGGWDYLYGGAGNDTLDGGTGGYEDMFGGRGNDTYLVNNSDRVHETAERGSGHDTVVTTVSFSMMEAGAQAVEDLVLIGGNARLGEGNDLANRLTGNSSDNELRGLRGNDTIEGGVGTDVIIGGRGKDQLTGGAGSDVFRFPNLKDSPLAAMDLLTDYATGDRLDFSEIDADTATAGNQGFTQVTAFTSQAGQLVLSYDAGSNRTTVSLDVNGDAVADMGVLLVGQHTSTAGWFL